MSGVSWPLRAISPAWLLGACDQLVRMVPLALPSLSDTLLLTPSGLGAAVRIDLDTLTESRPELLITPFDELTRLIEDQVKPLALRRS